MGSVHKLSEHGEAVHSQCFVQQSCVECSVCEKEDEEEKRRGKERERFTVDCLKSECIQDKNWPPGVCCNRSGEVRIVRATCRPVN